MKPRIGISGYPRVVETVLGPTLLHTTTHWYVDAVVAAGGVALLLPAVAPDDVDDVLDGLDGVVLTGGGDVAPSRYGEEPLPETSGVDPLRDEFDLTLVRTALARDVPVLAICRGMQVTNVALGGSLVQHVPAVVGTEHSLLDAPTDPAHDVELAPDSRLAAALGVTQLKVNSMHHQAVLEPAPGLRAVAWAGDGTVEAVEPEDGRPLVAVQWHPELMVEHREQQALFAQLVSAAARRRLRSLD